jgi:hypothetical protein
MASDKTAHDHPRDRRNDSAGNVDPLAQIEKRIVRSIGDALARLQARMDAAEAYASRRAHEQPPRQSALDRAAARWCMN